MNLTKVKYLKTALLQKSGQSRYAKKHVPLKCLFGKPKTVNESNFLVTEFLETQESNLIKKLFKILF